MTSARLLTRPSLTPKMAARSVPERPLSDASVSTRDRSRTAAASPVARWRRRRDCRCRHRDRRGRGRRRRASSWSQMRRARAHRLRSPRLRASALGVIGLLLVALERLDELADGLRPEDPRDEDDEPDPGSGPPGRRARRPRARVSFAAQTSACRRSFEAIRSNAAGSPGVLLDRGQRVVQDDRVALELEVLEAVLDVDRGHARWSAARRPRAAVVVRPA